MANSLNLKVATRKPKQELANRQVPGVVYGPDIDKNLTISADEVELNKVFDDAGYNKLIVLKEDGQDDVETLLKDVQYDPVSNNVSHFDLYAIKRGQKITTEIPVVLVGDAPAVQKGAVLNQFVEEIEVECLPSKLPEEFKIDISSLQEVGDSLSVEDIDAGEDVELLVDENLTIVRAEEVQELKVEDDGPVDGPSEEGEEGEEAAEGDSEASEEAAEDSSEESKKDEE